MVKKDLAETIKELQEKPEFIRNIGIVAHIDHGKTTLSDNLLAGAGVISKDLAGKIQFMDFDPQETERGITIFAANASMVHNVEGQEFLINLIDTPGHVDFGGDVTRAMRAVDGVIVVVDAVESVMPQTETVIRQALKERVKPILFINKVDRLIKELKLTPEGIQERLESIITKVNFLIKKYSEEQYKDKWAVDVNAGSVAFGSATQNWAINTTTIKKTGIGFNEVINCVENGESKKLSEKIPLYATVLDMIIHNLPNPPQAQKYRVQKIWPGNIDSEIGKDMSTCNPNGRLAAVVTKIYPDQHADYVAAVRIFSGKINSGQNVYLVSQGKENKVQQVSVYRGPNRIQMSEVKAGNIVGIVGLQDAYSGETLCEKENIFSPFESIKHIFEPVVTKAIEPRKTQQLAKFISILKRVSREDPTLQVKINEDTGQYLVSGLGELHIDAKIERPLKAMGIEVDVSPPIVIYRESVSERTQKAVEIESPNKLNKFFIIAEPLEAGVLDAMSRGVIPSELDLNKKDQRLIEDLIKNGMDKNQAKEIKLIYNKNILMLSAKDMVLQEEVINMIKDGFRGLMDEGPLAEEPCSGVKIILVDAKVDEDQKNRGAEQIVTSITFGFKEAMMKAKAILHEPKQVLRIDVSSDYVGGAVKEVQSRHGQIIEMREDSGSTIILVKIPISETFGFNSALKSATSGRGFFWMVDLVYEPMPKELEEKTILEIKKRNGLFR